MIGPALVGQSKNGRGQTAEHDHAYGQDNQDEHRRGNAEPHGQGHGHGHGHGHRHDDHDDGYTGTARLVTMDHELDVAVVVKGFFQPVDGRYRWHGRVSAPEGGLDMLAGRRHTAVLITPHGESLCEVYEPDLWGRFKVTGSSTPPFAVDHAQPFGLDRDDD